ncbi:MAG: UDP-N-acetylmuramate dehydrogenase [Clostridia bacterium]
MNKYQELENILAKENIKYMESMKKHTTMQVGGCCDCLVTPTTIVEISNVINWARLNNIRYFIIGNGSNLLVFDGLVHALIIKIANKFSEVKIEDNIIVASSGISMPKIAQIAKQNSLSGFEFACGIPGTIGGSTRMNAGAYGGEMSDIIESVTYLNERNEICTIHNADIKFAYRHSIFCEFKDYTILSVKFKLKVTSLHDIIVKMDENMQARRTKQPLEYPSAGSVFKRPVGYFVGKLITDCNLKGVSVGGAQVSTKHAGFVINTGNATCLDVLNLIKLIQKTVYEKFGVELKTELEIIGGIK